MKYRTIISIIILSPLFLCGCTEEETDYPRDSKAFSIEVSDGGFLSVEPGTATRATENGYQTVFTNGDRLGLIVTNSSSELVIDNKPFTFDGSKWTDADGSQNITYTEGYNYLVYYPYSETMKGKTTADDIKTAFVPKTDQRNYADYTASDLMIGENGTFNTAGNILRVTLQHVQTMLVLAPRYTYELGGQTYQWAQDNFSDGALTISGKVYVPWQSNTNETRLLLPASLLTNSQSISYSYTQRGQKKKGKATVKSGEVGKYQWIVPETSVYTLAPGAVYYADGILLPSDAGYTGSTPIGIVFCIDANRIGDAAKEALKKNGVDSPRGLVMALTNASEGCRWGDTNTDENKDGSEGEPFKDNTDKLNKQYNNVNGYAETRWIINAYESSGTTLQNTYTAFYHARRYGTADSGTSGYAAPDNTTGWFIPSMGQWWDILSNLGGIDLSSYQDNSQDGYKNISGAAPTAVNNMNKYLDKISGATTFSKGTYFWSSSEYISYSACYVSFSSYGNLNLDRSDKSYATNSVRCVLAF